jgi:hypothetical protein
MGVVEGDAPVSDNDWESVTKGGDAAIEKWIANQLNGTSCTIVLVGQNTAGRKWISYEISQSWNRQKGVLGVCIHNLKDVNQHQTLQGGNPFDHVTFTKTQAKLSTVVKLYNPPSLDSTNVYKYIKTNISDWVDEAIKIRDAHE